MLFHPGVQPNERLYDQIERTRVVLRRLTWSYVEDVDSRFATMLRGVLVALSRELDEARFASLCVTAVRRLADAHADATFAKPPRRRSSGGDPVERVMDEVRTLSEAVVSNQYIKAVDGLLDLLADLVSAGVLPERRVVRDEHVAHLVLRPFPEPGVLGAA